MQTRTPYCGHVFKKISTYNKIKFPQQANSMVGGTRRNWDNFQTETEWRVWYIVEISIKLIENNN